MPPFNKKPVNKRKGRGYPYGVGDGTRDAQFNEDGTPAEESKRDEEANEGAGEQTNNNDARPDDGVGDNPDAGIQAAEQIINVQPDQTIKLVVGPSEAKAAAKKEHPQDRINKFWTNFEPEYLGGITRILPDTVGEVAKTKKEDSGTSPKAVHSYENARDMCIKSVKRIIRECKTNNQKYTDPHFDIERDLKVTQNRDCLYGLASWDDDDADPGDVKRVTDIYEHPQFFKDGAGFDDIVQGYLGDCWLLAGLSAITANQELLRKICVIQDQDVGVYGFVFHRDGDWHPCIIDDKLYLAAPSFDESADTVLGAEYGIKQKEQEKLYLDTLQKGSKALYFASCRDDNETWVPLLEKAYAKAHGDFLALDGGQVGEALEDLTGGVTTEIYTTNILNKESHWRDLCRIGKDFIFSCHVSVFSNWRGVDDGERDRRLRGIVSSHAYSVLSTYEGYGQRLVKIRNPWGQTEWSGPWSDGSKEWTPEWLIRLDHKFGDDGVFWMSYDDMLRRYKYMDRTRLFGPEWYIAQEWTSVQVPWNCRDYQQTTFLLDVPEDTEAVIALSQLDDRYFKGLEGPYYYTLSFRVQKFGEDEDEDDYFARSPVHYELRRSTNVEVTLEKGRYTVLFKIEASKCGRKDIEKVIRENIWRRDKVTQMATLYDLAFRKGRLPEPEKKEEEKKEEEKKVEEKKGDSQPAPAEEKKEEKTEEKTEQKEEASEKKEETAQEQTKDTTEEKTEESKRPNFQFLAVNNSPGAEAGAEVGADESAQQPAADNKIVPDDTDPDRNPWNASCVVGLRVFSKLAELQVKVVYPGDKPDGVTLDRDDIAKAALQEAEKAEEKKQS